MKNNALISILVAVMRIVLAAVFIFSGFVKSVDPWGAAIKVGEYLSAFGMDWLSGGRFVIAVLLNSIELVLGLALLFRVRPKLVSSLVLVVMSCFTVLTLVIAIWQPVADCGCFGDAVKLSPWETFFKNIFLLILSVVLWAFSRDRHDTYYGTFTVRHGTSRGWGAILCMVAFAVGVNVYSVRHLPMIDFLPFRVGVNVAQGMAGGDDGSQIKTTLIYKDRASGQLQEFALSDTTWYDSLKWEYVDTRIEELKGGSSAGEHSNSLSDFNVFNRETDVTEQLLSSSVPIFLVTSVSPSDIPRRCRARLDSLITYAYNFNYPVVLATPAVSDNPAEGMGLAFGSVLKHMWYSIDATLLKTMLRADEGVVVLKEGTIIAKWNCRDIPRFSSKSNPDAMSVILSNAEGRRERDIVIISFALLLVVLAGYVLIRKK